MLGYVNNGHAQIRAEYIGAAPLEGDDTRMLVASYTGPADFGGNTRYASTDNTNSLADIAGNLLGGLFSYADANAVEQDAAIGSAHAAVNAMASQNTALADWAQSDDVDGRAYKVGLGVFGEYANAIDIAQQFALLGAVDETLVTVSGKPATQLTFTQLKPGAARVDVLNMARELGLTDIILY
jgi:rare lipoprotein A